tara:strand:- start:795 stop:968 length:174 start_codon:yes stop_codon:yes gene_type:complete
VEEVLANIVREIKMPMPNNCVECDKPASLLLVGVPYCPKHYKEEVENAEKKEESRIL